MKIYAALYNPMIHESTWGIISLHETRKGAEMAVEFHKHESDNNQFQSWFVREFELFT
jgi:hypothetical protein